MSSTNVRCALPTAGVTCDVDVEMQTTQWAEFRQTHEKTRYDPSRSARSFSFDQSGGERFCRETYKSWTRVHTFS